MGRRSVAVLCAVICIGGFGVTLRTGQGVQWLEQAALLSAALSMPAESVPLLERRFSHVILSYRTAERPLDEGDAHLSDNKPTAASSLDTASNGEPAPTSSNPAPNAVSNVTDTKPLPLAPFAHKEAAIPTAFQGVIVQETFAPGQGALTVKNNAALKNDTNVPDKEVLSLMNSEMPFSLSHNGNPEVLIIHTHATEAFEPADAPRFDTRNEWRTRNNAQNMVAVGERLADTLKNQGISVLHDKTHHDYPSYNGAYERSAKTIQTYLDKYPSVKIVLDLHRDAIFRNDSTAVKPVVQTPQGKAAQIMIITGCENGSLNVPRWKENLKFAANFQSALESRQPGLTRPIFFCYRKYNMDKTTGSLLLEFGSNANTLEEALLSAQLAGEALGTLLCPAEESPFVAESAPAVS